MNYNQNTLKIARGALAAHHAKLARVQKYGGGSEGQIRQSIKAMEERIREIEKAIES